MDDKNLTCIDCLAGSCNKENQAFPSFCVCDKIDESVLGDAMAQYEKEENRRVAIAAAEVENDNYCKMTRVEETMEFAKKIGAKKIGIATCLGLLKEAGIFARILRKNGFEVYGISCKAGTQKKVDIGVPERCEAVGANMCNPILQAKMLNAEHTDLNVLVGLCVGHDSLFYKHSDALVTTLVAKDRVLCHNPAGALYQADNYYKAKFE